LLCQFVVLLSDLKQRLCRCRPSRQSANQLQASAALISNRTVQRSPTLVLVI
jgi:hypothetical protein